MTSWVVVVLVMLAEGIFHYFPWRLLLKGKELPRVVAYALGVMGLMAPFSAWLWYRGEVEVILMLWVVIVAGGMMVLALYGLDRYLELEMRNVEATEERNLRRKGSDSQT